MSFFEDRAMTELLSGLGAGLIGMSIGVKFSQQLRKVLISIFILGVLAHSAGMFATKQLDKAGGEVSPLMMWLYYACWMFLGLLLVYFIYASKKKPH